MKSVDSTTCSQDSASGPHCTPDNSSTHPQTLLIWRPILIISSCVRLHLPSSSYLHFSLQKFSYAFRLIWWVKLFIYEYELTEAMCNTEASSQKSLLPLKNNKYYKFSVCVCSLSCPTCNANGIWACLALPPTPPHTHTHYLINVKYLGEKEL
jgi:hypothetical protein